MKRLTSMCLIVAFGAAGLTLNSRWGAFERSAYRPSVVESEDCTVSEGDTTGGMPSHALDYYKNWGTRDESLGPVQACFAKGTPDDVVSQVTRLLTPNPNGERYNIGNRWSGPLGSPRALTYSFVPDGLNISSGVGEPAAASQLFATLDARFAAQGGRAKWLLRFEQTFERWALVCGTSYTRITFGGNDWDDGASWGTPGAAGQRGDVRICMKPIDNGFGILAYNFFPENGDMVLDKDENWEQQSGFRNNLFMRSIIAHEHGHGLGMYHICPIGFGRLMEPFLSSIAEPCHDSMRAAHYLYGDANEDNDTSATATNAGAVETGTPVTLGAIPPPLFGSPPANSSLLGIESAADSDYYRFSVAGHRIATVTVTPQGYSYDSADQACAGQTADCCSGEIVDSKIVANLRVQILSTDGATVLGDADLQPVGVAETLADVDLPAAGNYYVLVTASNSPVESQQYTLTASVATPCEAPSVTPPLMTDSTACGVTYASDAPSASGTGPFTWSLDGTPPAGVTIDPGTGVVSWPSPVASNTDYSILIRAEGSCGSDGAVLMLTVAPGDYDGDGVTGLTDVPAFVDDLLGLGAPSPCAGDVNLDAATNGEDVQAFVQRSF